MFSPNDLRQLNRIVIPKRIKTLSAGNGLEVYSLHAPSEAIDAQFVPYKTRGDVCSRVLCRARDGRQYVLEFKSYNEEYPEEVTGVIRVKDYAVEGGSLNLQHSLFRDAFTPQNELVEHSEQVRTAWKRGIQYRSEVREGEEIIQPGLRSAQSGALHAIAAHWTTSSKPALIVMPTGTGKTEVMIAASVGNAAERVLVVVPSDALRIQTAQRFEKYSLLQKIGVVQDIPNPVIGVLGAKPAPDHFELLEVCNVVVTTMAAIGSADEDVQAQFANLFSHVFFDEAHHIQAPKWKKFHEMCGNALVVQLTATPFREDGKSLDGKIIYNFPLDAAQEQGYFRQINFVEVFEPDSAHADERIAEAAVDQLRQDIAQGRDHILMARARTIPDAERIFSEIYEQNYADLNPVVVHSQTKQRAAILKRIKNGEHQIVVCVDMFGEGYDLPNLKIAAMHSVHKSLGITLQFIGRFTRADDNVGTATFIANTAEDDVPDALESLYLEDSDWNALVPNLSYEAIAPQEQLSELVNNLRHVGQDDEAVEISTLALRPKTSAQIFRTNRFTPGRYQEAFRKTQKILQPQISNADNFLVLIVNQKGLLDWTDSKELIADTWDLYLAYYDPEKRLLYIHGSNKGMGSKTFAKAISEDPQQIEGEDVFKSFSGLQRLVLHSVGLTSRSKNVRYQMFAGLDVRNAIDPEQQQDKMKSNITGVGYEDGRRISVGCSRKGKFWSMNTGSLAHWKNWCDEVGTKITAGVAPDDFLRHTLVPDVINDLPGEGALMADWPDRLFESSNFSASVFVGEDEFDFHDCQIDLLGWTAPDSFQFQLKIGEGLIENFELTIIRRPEAESTYSVGALTALGAEISTGGERKAAEEYFQENPPLVRFADGSQLSGNFLLRPREELAEVFERQRIQTIDWRGVDLRTESMWRHGERRQNSIQERFIRHLEESDATFIFDDDDTGESADVVSIEERDRSIEITLWHCKYAHGDQAGARASDLYEVCGQAQKSTKWTWDFKRLVKHLIRRETDVRHGRDSRFIRGSVEELVTLRKSARKKFVNFHIGIVQPGISQANIPNEQLAIIGATNAFVRCITDKPLKVFGNT